jgi:hypothetical protein
MMVRAFQAIPHNPALREISPKVLAAAIQNANDAGASAKSHEPTTEVVDAHWAPP